ncbi:hypothetical protein EVAR_31968_1 [Eumeta japonica]|uniref:Uncharacterized protein n=1 Tax=Eumeta variegata TaxID=151549 RepID=A0A4C1VSI7_EUMVA|nr:hypothetical protein EVAR_31968_1 [Eumeta japonica]
MAKMVSLLCLFFNKRWISHKGSHSCICPRPFSCSRGTDGEPGRHRARALIAYTAECFKTLHKHPNSEEGSPQSKSRYLGALCLDLDTDYVTNPNGEQERVRDRNLGRYRSENEKTETVFDALDRERSWRLKLRTGSESRSWSTARSADIEDNESICMYAAIDIGVLLSCALFFFPPVRRRLNPVLYSCRRFGRFSRRPAAPVSTRRPAVRHSAALSNAATINLAPRRPPHLHFSFAVKRRSNGSRSAPPPEDDSLPGLRNNSLFHGRTPLEGQVKCYSAKCHQ